MSDAGYVRIHRKILGNPAFRNDAEAMAFAWMVVKAAWKPTKVRYKGHTLTLQRGELSVSVRDFAEAMDRPKGWAERLFERLRKHAMIEQKSRTGGGTGSGTPKKTGAGTPPAIITICNYDEYQAVIDAPRTPNETPDETRSGQTPDTEQRREKGNKEDISPPTPHRENDWPVLPDWLPAVEWNAWLDMRRDKRKWPTAHAIELTLKKLTDWRIKGHDPGPILDAATENSWTTIYEPKEPRNANRGQTNQRNSPSRDGDDRSHFARAVDNFGGLPYDRPDEPAGAADGHATGPGGAGGEPPSAQVIPLLR